MDQPGSKAVRPMFGPVFLLRGRMLGLNLCARSALRLHPLHTSSIPARVDAARALRVCSSDFFRWQIEGVNTLHPFRHSREGGNLLGDCVRLCLAANASDWRVF